MFKKACILLIILFAASYSNAQSIGIQAGLDFYRPHIFSVNDYSRTVNPAIGMNILLPFAKRSYFRTGIYYAGLKYTGESGFELWTGNYELTHNNIILPLQFGVNLVNRDVDAGIFFGPRLGYNIKLGVYGYEYHGTNTLWNFLIEPTYNFNRLYGGFAIGSTVAYKNYNVTLHYSFDVLIPGGSENFMPWAEGIISLSIGYSLFPGRKE